jgi:uncharacterized repeat protein (TIGR04138 family)
MSQQQTQRKSLEQVVEEYGHFPIEAFEFVRHGLSYAVQQVHGDVEGKPEAACHISGKQLSTGLRDYALMRYGVMARAVMAHWGIHRTMDFGRIVFAMVDSKLMFKTDHDDIRDFEGVFDFEEAFAPPQRPRCEQKAVFHL